VREHGTYAKYVAERCRCELCRAANRSYERARTRRKAYGREPWVDAAPARRHVKKLMASGPGQTDGVGLKQIVKVSGVSHGCLWKLVYGKNGKPSKRIHRDTEQKLLAVTPADAAKGATVPAGETWKLADEIVAFFNSQNPRRYGGKAKLGRYLTGNPNAQSLQLSRYMVSVKHAQMVKVLHDQLEKASEVFRWRFCSCQGDVHEVAS
jgi:hypothetical protein